MPHTPLDKKGSYIYRQVAGKVNLFLIQETEWNMIQCERRIHEDPQGTYYARDVSVNMQNRFFTDR
jgi:hypothetical protein